MSPVKTEGSLLTIANLLFGISWKPYASNEAIVDSSLLSMSNSRIEAEMLFSIFE